MRRFLIPVISTLVIAICKHSCAEGIGPQQTVDKLKLTVVSLDCDTQMPSLWILISNVSAETILLKPDDISRVNVRYTSSSVESNSTTTFFHEGFTGSAPRKQDSGRTVPLAPGESFGKTVQLDKTDSILSALCASNAVSIGVRIRTGPTAEGPFSETVLDASVQAFPSKGLTHRR
jgi:hypothetical protein